MGVIHLSWLTFTSGQTITYNDYKKYLKRHLMLNAIIVIYEALLG